MFAILLYLCGVILKNAIMENENKTELTAEQVSAQALKNSLMAMAMAGAVKRMFVTPEREEEFNALYKEILQKLATSTVDSL